MRDLNILVATYPFGVAETTRTDEQGRYSACGVRAAKLAMMTYGGDYTTAFKYDLPPRDQTVDFVMHPLFEAPVAGGTVTGVIRGDEFIAGDDEFGGRCVATACKVVGLSYSGCPCRISEAEITLRWSDPSSQLAVYVPLGDVYFPPRIPPPLADRYCCSSGLTTRIKLNTDYDVFAIGFEQADGGRPGPADSQTFELTVRPIP